MPGPSGFLSGIARPGTDQSPDQGDATKRARKRGGDFPYDKPVLYGTARGIDDTGAGFADMRSLVGTSITPKDTTHTPWDDETGELENEASGTPVSLGRSAGGNGAGGGGTIPGTAGGWASPPWDRDTDDEVERAGDRKLPESWSCLAEALEIDLPEEEEPVDPMSLSEFLLGDDS